ncbi:MAG TPA: hypothetical protein VHO01_10900 [Jatrophihabitans sp.]|nr:hypothetical protein [Jatrophihabitans sp.]
MARNRVRTPQQRDARELALTPQANPYRGALTDPFGATMPARPLERAQPLPPVAAVAQSGVAAGWPVPEATGPGASAPAGIPACEPLPRPGQPGAVTLAGIIGILLGLALGVFGLLLVTIVSLQAEYGAPDRSFYRGTDSGYVILGLLDFGLAVLCGVGGIVLFTGRLAGRVALTIGGWACLLLSAYWLTGSTVSKSVPLVVAAAAAVMLWAMYTRRVTRWLGVLPAPQPD